MNALLLLSLALPSAPPMASYLEHPTMAVQLEAVMDPAVLIGAGFGHSVSLGVRQLELAYALRITPSLSTGDLAATAGMRMLEQDGFDVLFGSGVEMKLLSNDVHDGASMNLRFSAEPGWFSRHWFVRGELSTQFTAFSVLSHKEAYRQQFPEVHDGVVGPTAPVIYVGGTVGGRLGAVLLDLRFAWRVFADLKSYAPYYQPYTVGFRASYQF